jgi:hypothetical protein
MGELELVAEPDPELELEWLSIGGGMYDEGG